MYEIQGIIPAREKWPFKARRALDANGYVGV